ncbi:MAG: hypothetical protein ACD_33C00002G0032 [uncultured bacterium]|nr:MAG: hypothetical protein ACD_33C00002G0032 [uncultured bacterium]
MGIVVNDFVKTPVGLLVTFLIVWNFMGSMMIHVAVGLFILILGSIFIFKFMNNCCTVTKIYVDDKNRKDIFGRSVLKEINKACLSNTEQATILFSAIILSVVSILIIFTW